MNENLTFDQDGLDLTEASESLRLIAYPDPGTGGAPWTNGYGHTGSDVYEGQVIDLEQAIAWLKADVADAEAAVKRLVTVELTQHQYDALVDFVFNIGSGNFQHSTLLRLLNSGDTAGASLEFDRWNKAAGKVLNGLVIRRNAEEALFDV